MPDRPGNQPAPPASTDQPAPSDSPNPGPAQPAPAPPAVDPVLHDPSKLDPSLRAFAMETERRMQGLLTKRLQEISGQKQLLEQLAAAKKDPRVARMFGEELMRFHGQSLDAPQNPRDPGPPDDSSAIPEEALADGSSLGKHINKQIRETTGSILDQKTAEFEAQRVSDQRQIRTLEGRLNKERYPLYDKYESDIDSLMDRNQNLSTDQAYQLATAEEREFQMQQRFKAESDQKVADAEASFTEVDSASGMVDEPLDIKDDDDLESIFGKVKEKAAASA